MFVAAEWCRISLWRAWRWVDIAFLIFHIPVIRHCTFENRYSLFLYISTKLQTVNTGMNKVDYKTNRLTTMHTKSCHHHWVLSVGDRPKQCLSASAARLQCCLMANLFLQWGLFYSICNVCLMNWYKDKSLSICCSCKCNRVTYRTRRAACRTCNLRRYRRHSDVLDNNTYTCLRAL